MDEVHTRHRERSRDGGGAHVLIRVLDTLRQRRAQHPLHLRGAVDEQLHRRSEQLEADLRRR